MAFEEITVSRAENVRRSRELPVKMLVIAAGLALLSALVYSFRDSLLGEPPPQRYLDKIDKFTFLFPQGYDLDASLEATKRYGQDYLVGFKHKDDPRIGCEVRKKAGLPQAGEVAKTFDMTDPLGAVQTISQQFIAHDNNTYLLICGAGKAYYGRFAADFRLFFDSFKFPLEKS